MSNILKTDAETEEMFAKLKNRNIIQTIDVANTALLLGITKIHVAYKGNEDIDQIYENTVIICFVDYSPIHDPTEPISSEKLNKKLFRYLSAQHSLMQTIVMLKGRDSQS